MSDLSKHVHANAVREAGRLSRELGETQRALDGAYLERNYVVAALARAFPSGTAITEIPGWDPCWHNCVYIDLPTGQISFHYHDNQKDLFADLPAYEGEWDGHSKEEVFERIRNMRMEDGEAVK